MNGYEYAAQYAKFILLRHRITKYCNTKYGMKFYIISKMNFSYRTAYYIKLDSTGKGYVKYP